jgi:hypothetical protein
LKLKRKNEIVSSAFAVVSDTIFGHGKPSGVITWTILLLFFLGGAAHWFAFFNFGKFSLERYDWPKEYQYYSVIKESIDQRVLPYHVLPLIQSTSRFLAIPETVFSPQIIALSFLSIGSFVTMNVLLMYSVGFLGCLLIRARYKLSLFSFAFLFLIFNFNGHIIFHLAVGHSMWLGYYLLPFFCLFLTDLLENPDQTSITILLSVVLFAIFLQGSFHILFWCLLFLGLLLLLNLRFAKPLLLIFAFTAALSTVRLLPACTTYGQRSSIGVWGYSSVGQILESLVIMHSAEKKIADTSIMWGECNLYIDLIGFCFLIYFGLYFPLRKKPENLYSAFSTLGFPMLGMVVLSISAIYSIFHNLPIPLAGSETISSRFLIIPLLFLLLFSIRSCDVFLMQKAPSAKSKALLLIALLLLTISLITNSKVWSEEVISAANMPFEGLKAVRIVQQSDLAYVACVKVGFFVSVIALIFLVIKYFRSNRASSLYSQSS